MVDARVTNIERANIKNVLHGVLVELYDINAEACVAVYEMDPRRLRSMGCQPGRENQNKQGWLEQEHQRPIVDLVADGELRLRASQRSPEQARHFVLRVIWLALQLYARARMTQQFAEIADLPLPVPIDATSSPLSRPFSRSLSRP
ncbi:MAG: hypothetical protein AAGH71_02885 [Planctomycetota bacterium]